MFALTHGGWKLVAGPSSRSDGEHGRQQVRIRECLRQIQNSLDMDIALPLYGIRCSYTLHRCVVVVQPRDGRNCASPWIRHHRIVGSTWSHDLASSMRDRWFTPNRDSSVRCVANPLRTSVREDSSFQIYGLHASCSRILAQRKACFSLLCWCCVEHASPMQI